MALAGSAIHQDFHSAQTPQIVIRAILASSAELDRLGYSVESHSTDTLVLVRRFIPSIAYSAPLTVAGVIFVLGIISGSTHSAHAAGVGALICVGIAAVLSVTIRTSERVTFTAGPEGEGSRVLVSGAAIPQLKRWIADAGAPDGPA